MISPPSSVYRSIFKAKDDHTVTTAVRLCVTLLLLAHCAAIFPLPGGSGLRISWNSPPGVVFFNRNSNKGSSERIISPLRLKGGRMPITSLSDLKKNGNDEEGIPAEAMAGPVDGEKLSKWFMGTFVFFCLTHCQHPEREHQSVCDRML